ncbi:restriction endonuclease subunit S [Anabaena sp. UHCC 0187]|nr:restriction endonuclease subunit S [Anabaena sp. UHCC 0187]MTJ11551.1 restriction endonuclease subunit S [Anabaena sp. UHCC 0187]
MGNYQGYQKYKDSGVEWLGDIPEHWEVKRFKFLLSEPFKYGANEAAEIDDPNLPRYIRITDVKDDGNLRDDTFRSLPEEIAKDYILEESDILLARSGATVGKTFIYRKSWGKAAYAGYLIRARVSGQNNSDFIYKFLQSKLYWDWVKSIFIQATIQNISAEKYSNLFITIPPLNEQEKIAQFLDYKTKQIDELIKKKETLIEKLDEKRTALISHAVTKGLNSSVPMKDSGIEWLGNIPEHWDVRHVKRVADISYGVGGEIDRSLTEGINLLSLPNVTRDGNLLVDEYGFCELSDFEKVGLILQKGDLLFNWRNGSSSHLGKTAYFDLDGEWTNVSFLLRIRFNMSQFCSRYFQYMLNGLRITGFFMVSKAGVNNTFNLNELSNLKIICPVHSEQKQIAEYLDQKTTQIDIQKAKIKQAIELLKEYRTSLITNAVTGKIDVSQVDIP